MRSVLHALVWDYFRFSGWIQPGLVAATLTPLILYASILSVAPESVQPNDPVMLLLEVSMLPFVIFVLLLSAGTSHANMAQLYTKPLSNLSIAAWRGISGAAILAIEMTLIVSLYNGIYNVGWPLVGAVVFTLAAWFAAQPFFCLAGKSILGTLLTMIPLALMCVWFITRYKPIGGVPRDWNEISLSETLQMLTVIAVFGWSSIGCVGLARRSENLPLPTWIGEWFTRVFSFPLPGRISTKPFRSPGHALFWYEWRWKGWTMAACMLVLLAIIVPATMWQAPTLENFFVAVTSAYMGTVFPAMIMGVVSGFQLESMQISGKANSRLSDIDELRSFQGTRPVSDTALSNVNLWVSLAGIGLITAIWLVLAGPVILIAASQAQLGGLAHGRPILAVPLTAFLMWIYMGNMVAVTSTGRTKQIGLAFIALLLGYVALLCGLEWLDKALFTQRVQQTLLVCATVALIVFAVWAHAQALQLGFIKRSQIAIALTVIALIAVAFGWLWPHWDIVTVSITLCAGVLCILPWATTPLAMSWNRHR